MWVISSRTIQGVDYAHTPWPFSRICSSQGGGIHSSVLYSDVGLRTYLDNEDQFLTYLLLIPVHVCKQIVHEYALTLHCWRVEEVEGSTWQTCIPTLNPSP